MTGQRKRGSVTTSHPDRHPRVTAEELSRWLAASGMKPSSRQTYVATLRQVYAWGIRADLIDRTPALDVDSGRQRRRDGLQPFQSWEEIERVADETGRWGPLVIFAADCGARLGELVALTHRDVEDGKVRLPGTRRGTLSGSST